MRWPGHVPAGKSCDAPMMTIDMFPTIARLIGGKLPDHKIDGLDISDVILGKTDKSPHDVLYFYYHQNDLEALRSGKWKLEFARTYQSLNGRPGGKNGRRVDYSQLKIVTPQLYDLDADPGQHKDVAAQQPDVLKTLMDFANSARIDLGDHLTGQKGDGHRQPGRAGDAVYPSDPGFDKATDEEIPPRRKK